MKDVVMVVGVEDAPHEYDHDWSCSVCEGCRDYPLRIHAASVDTEAEVEARVHEWGVEGPTFSEIEPGLWRVSDRAGHFVGLVGTSSWDEDEVRQRAAEAAE